MLKQTINIEHFSHNLEFHNGIWHAQNLDKISYPTDGNDLCFEIEDQSFWFNGRNRIISEVIKKHSLAGPIFDVGGGNGFVANYLTNEGFEPVLVEPGIDGCLHAKERGLKCIINSFFDTTHFYANSIPNIGIFDVLEHIQNPDDFLNTLNTLLIPDGRLFITVPAFNSLWSEEDKHASHYRRYRIKELQKQIAGHGFDIIYSTYFFSFLFLPVFIFRAIPTKIGLYKTDSQKTKNQHFVSSTSGYWLDLLIKIEQRIIRKAQSIKFGSSILLVGKKR